MVHNQLHAIDLIIIAAYLISMVLIGVVVVKKVQSMDDYYLGGDRKSVGRERVC